jgi:flagellin-like hook-associated protein FlgL
MNKVLAAITKLRGYASDFGNAYSVVQNREDFTKNLVNVLTTGADKLTLADMNEESANMLALQTRQQLGVNSLSLASQAQQSVLKLF